MDICGEVADMHVGTDAMKLATKARTIHSPEQKEALHMI